MRKGQRLHRLDLAVPAAMWPVSSLTNMLVIRTIHSPFETNLPQLHKESFAIPCHPFTMKFGGHRCSYGLVIVRCQSDQRISHHSTEGSASHISSNVWPGPCRTGTLHTTRRSLRRQRLHPRKVGDSAWFHVSIPVNTYIYELGRRYTCLNPFMRHTENPHHLTSPYLSFLG